MKKLYAILAVVALCLVMMPAAQAVTFSDNFDNYTDGNLPGQVGPNGQTWYDPRAGQPSTGPPQVSAIYKRGATGKGVGTGTSTSYWYAGMLPLGETVSSGTYILKADFWHGFASSGSWTVAVLEDTVNSKVFDLAWDAGKLEVTSDFPFTDGLPTITIPYSVGWVHAEAYIDFTNKTVQIAWSNPDGMENFTSALKHYSVAFAPNRVGVDIYANSYQSQKEGVDNLSFAPGSKPLTSTFWDKYDGYTDGNLSGQLAPNGNTWYNPNVGYTWAAEGQVSSTYTRGGVGKGIGASAALAKWHTNMVSLEIAASSGVYTLSADMWHGLDTAGSWTIARLRDAVNVFDLAWDAGKLEVTSDFPFTDGTPIITMPYSLGWVHAEAYIDLTNKTVQIAYFNPYGEQEGVSVLKHYSVSFAPNQIGTAVYSNSVQPQLEGMDNLRLKTGQTPLRAKKIVGFASNKVEPAYFKNNIDALELLPVDGLEMAVYADNWTGARNGQQERWFGGKDFVQGDFTQVVADLKATQYQRFRENFILLGTTVRGTSDPAEYNLDWYDATWSGIANNAAVAAWIAKQAGFKGLYIDVEAYADSSGEYRWPFDYYSNFGGSTPPAHTYAEYQTKVRARGGEFMQAITAQYPNITIVMIQNTGGCSSLLVDSFVKGLLDYRGTATIVDGGETAYSYIVNSAFVNLRAQAEDCHTDPLYAPLQYAFGTWIDCQIWPFSGWYTDPSQFYLNYRTPFEMENTLYFSLTNSDKYAWLFTSYPALWWNPTISYGQISSIPQQYLDALVNCWGTHDLNWSPDVKTNRYVYFDAAKLTKNNGNTNLLSNPGFETWPDPETSPPSPWILGGTGGQLIFRERTRKYAGINSARLTTTAISGQVFIDQEISITPYLGSTMHLKSQVWSDMVEVGDLQIIYWVGGSAIVTSSSAHTGNGTWQYLTVDKAIPSNASGILRLRLSAGIPFMRP